MGNRLYVGNLSFSSTSETSALPSRHRRGHGRAHRNRPRNGSIAWLRLRDDGLAAEAKGHRRDERRGRRRSPAPRERGRRASAAAVAAAAAAVARRRRWRRRRRRRRSRRRAVAAAVVVAAAAIGGTAGKSCSRAVCALAARAALGGRRRSATMSVHTVHARAQNLRLARPAIAIVRRGGGSCRRDSGLGMRLAMIGLGKMGDNMTQRLHRGRARGRRVRPEPRRRARAVARAATARPTSRDRSKLEAPRVVWIMVPAGKPTDAIITEAGQRFRRATSSSTAATPTSTTRARARTKLADEGHPLRRRGDERRRLGPRRTATA